MRSGTADLFCDLITEVLCCSTSGCNPASHKICKNNAITKTVYKVAEVTVLAGVMSLFCVLHF